MRYVLLFSYIIPISLRVNLDVAKLVYSWFIHNDDEIPGTVVRSSTLPEELGRIQYLLSDKTGTRTILNIVFARMLARCASVCARILWKLPHLK